MKSALTIVLAAAACLAAGAMAFADNGATYYTASNPRIIQVPQRGDDVRASHINQSHASVRRIVPADTDDDVAPSRSRRAVQTDIRPQPRLPLKQQAKEQVRAPAKVAVRQEPVAQPARRKPFNVANPSSSLPEPVAEPEPEPTGPRRALLSAPPPTPRFGQPMAEPVETLTTFTPPPMPKPEVAARLPEPMPEPVAAQAAADDDDHLPPPGDPRLAPPEPAR